MIDIPLPSVHSAIVLCIFQKPYILFNEFAIEAVPNGCPDVVEIFSVHSDSSTTSLGSYCGLHETLKVKSSTNSMLVRFTTNIGYTYRGFQGTFGIDNPTLGLYGTNIGQL